MLNEVYEYTVDKKREGKYKLARILMVSFYVAFFVGFFILISEIKLYPVFAIAPIILWILVLATWRFVSVEYKYTVSAGVLTLMSVYGGKTKKVRASLRIKEFEAILPLASADELINTCNGAKTYNLLSSKIEPKDAYVVITRKEGKRIVAFIEAPTPSLKEILYYTTEEVRQGLKR